MIRYLITGGSGFLGINLIRYLESKHGGKCFIRSLDIVPFDYPDIQYVEAVRGDIRDKDVVEKAMKGIDVVVHCAAALPLYSAKEIYTTDIEGTKTVIDSAWRNKIDRFVHISSTAVYGIPDHHPIYEDDKLDGVGPYGKAKIEAENICLRYRKRGMCVPILRPKSFIGPERLGVFALLYDWAKDGKNFPILGSGDNRYQLLDVEDLCQATYLSITKDKNIVNDIFNIGAEKFDTLKEDYQAVLDRAGFGKRIVSLPASPMIWMLRTLEFLRLSPLYKWVYETVTKDSFVSIDRAKQKLGFRPQYSNKQALVRNYEWYLANLTSFKNKSGVSHRVPWKQGILKLFKLFF